jgi:hypothetical protein
MSTNHNLEKILSLIATTELAPAEKVQVADALLASKTKKLDDDHLSASAAVEPIILSQALAAARRAGVEVDQKTGRINVVDLNASLAKSTMTPLQKIETKTLLAAARMID